LTENTKQRPRLFVVWREARALVWARRYRLAIGLALMLVSRLAGLVLPATSKFLVDRVIGEQRLDLLPPLALVAGSAVLVQSAGAFALAQLLGITAQRSITELRKRVQQHVLRLPVSYFDATRSGVLISRIMNDAEGIRNLVGTGLVQLTGSLMTASAALVILLLLNWRLTLIMLFAIVAFGLLLMSGLTRLRPLYRQHGEIHAQVTGRLAEALGGVRVAKAYGAEKHEDLVFARGAHRLYRNVAKTITMTSLLTSTMVLILGLATIAIMVIGARAILHGEMTLGDLVMYVAFTGMMVAPLAQVASIGAQLSEAFAGLDRIREIRSLVTEDDRAGCEPVAYVRGDVRFENVTFEYQPGVPVLENVSFDAAAGSTTALVGSSGSGKSTVMGLIMAFYRPHQGRVLIDGADLARLRLRDYRRRIGVVLQESFLFDGTIAENISYSKPTASRQEVEKVGRLAHCDEFVDRFEKGYDTVIGERGVRLSGGQRQRVAIARAILADPKILLLDEATSSLDSRAEALIQDGLRSLRRGRTTFVIAHRLSTIRSAGQILVLESGKLVERGTHRQLLALEGRYRELHDQQSLWAQDRFINPGEDFVGPDRASDTGAIRRDTARPSLRDDARRGRAERPSRA
jgi:ABC-type multidrug transport system fused ATPase/permease subunit